ncbi:MAG: hypothetical protein HW416_2949 [Chloroflexi bacterium]|nr:hypothetical protein [Chloroflexota bacterium]
MTRPEGTGRSSREMMSTAALVISLLAYANVDAWAAFRRERAAERRGSHVATSLNPVHGLMTLVFLGWAALDGFSASELGLQRQGLRRSIGWGLALGVAGSAVIRLFFALPLAAKRAVTQPEYHHLSRARLLLLVFFQFLVGTSVFEEITFRGLLHAKLSRTFGTHHALVLGSAVFAGWHAVITAYNLRRSNLPRKLFPFMYVGAMAVLFVAGWLLGLLRVLTGHVGGGVLAHWMMVANVVLSVVGRRD